jgi:hypothetical protein
VFKLFDCMYYGLNRFPNFQTVGCESPRVPTHGRMGRGSHGLPKVSPAPTMTYPSMPCRQATPKTVLGPFQEWPAQSTAVLQPSPTPLENPRRSFTFLHIEKMENSLISDSMATPCHTPMFISEINLPWPSVCWQLENAVSGVAFHKMHMNF